MTEFALLTLSLVVTAAAGLGFMFIVGLFGAGLLASPILLARHQDKNENSGDISGSEA